MRAAASEEALPDIRFTKQKLDIFLRPIPRRQGLQKHHHFLWTLAVRFGSFRLEGR